MNVTSISDIFKKKIPINTYVMIQGWIRSRRVSKLGISFLDIYDGSIIYGLQIIARNILKNYYTDILKISIGCSVHVEGLLIKSYKNSQLYEIEAKLINVIGKIKNPDRYPISRKKHTLEYIRSWSHLRPRTNIIGVLTRIRSFSFYKIHNFLKNNEFYWISTPIITGIDAEGAGNMFKVSILDSQKHCINNNTQDFENDFFKKNSFLTVSGQLTLESYACALSKVYSFGPTFRAEDSNTIRHLAEFWMLEVELAFASLKKIIFFAEKLLKHIVKQVIKNCYQDLLFLKNNVDSNIFTRLEKFLKNDFIILEYKDVVNLLKKHNNNFNQSINWGDDLSTIHEKYLVEKHFNNTIVICNYPKNIKAFYMKINDDEQTVSAFDILFPRFGEIVGGSEREFRLSYLEKRMKELDMTSNEYDWYKDLRRYGTVPHSGFGLGFDRFIAYITGIKNIREVVPFPRTKGSLKF